MAERKNVPLAPVVDMRTKQPYIEPDNVPLGDQLGFDGGSGGGSMESNVSMKDYVDARDDAVESRLAAKLDKLPTAGQMWAAVLTTIGGVFAIVTAGFAVLAFGGDRFDSGVSVGPQIESARKAQADVDAAQNAQSALMDDKLDLIVQQTANR